MSALCWHPVLDICRRSFSTNLYGKIPTPVIMSITGHSTEKMFLTYIGKTQKDNAEILKQYWEDQKKPPKMTVVKMSQNQ